MRKPKRHKPLNDLNRSHTPFDVNHTLIVVVELSQKSWLVAGVIPGVERQPLKKLEPGEDGLLKLIHRWRDEAEKVGHKITRIAVAFEAGRDGFWLARWLRARGVEAHVIHASSVAEGLSQSGNARVRRGMVLLAWRFLQFQKDSALAQWFYARTAKAPRLRKKMIVALARKLLIALWRLVREGVVPEGVTLRPAH